MCFFVCFVLLFCPIVLLCCVELSCLGLLFSFVVFYCWVERVVLCPIVLPLCCVLFKGDWMVR